MAFFTTNRVLGTLLTLCCTDCVVASDRYSDGRTTTDIVVGCCILGVFLVVVAVSILYCRFCTKRKREEWKNRSAVIPVDSPPEAEVGEEIVPTIGFSPPSVASSETVDVVPRKDESDQEDAKCENTVSSISSLSTDRKGLSPIEEL